MPKIEMGKKYEIRAGVPVTILTVTAEDLYHGPVVGLVKGWDGPQVWSIDGEYQPKNVNRNPNYDLIEVQPELEGWVNIYPWNGVLYPFKFGGNSQAHAFETKDEADAEATPNRIACIKIKFKKGEGL